jgi:hypothetical protein
VRSQFVMSSLRYSSLSLPTLSSRFPIGGGLLIVWCSCCMRPSLTSPSQEAEDKSSPLLAVWHTGGHTQRERGGGRKRERKKEKEGHCANVPLFSVFFLKYQRVSLGDSSVDGAGVLCGDPSTWGLHLPHLHSTRKGSLPFSHT